MSSKEFWMSNLLYRVSIFGIQLRYSTFIFQIGCKNVAKKSLKLIFHIDNYIDKFNLVSKKVLKWLKKGQKSVKIDFSFFLTKKNLNLCLWFGISYGNDKKSKSRVQATSVRYFCFVIQKKGLRKSINQSIILLQFFE